MMDRKPTCCKCGKLKDRPSPHEGYCSACRSEASRRYREAHPKNKPALGFARRCIYCNDEATARDHIIPVSFVSVRKRRGKWPRGQNRDFQVSSCIECNNLLSNFIFDTMDNRMEYLIDRLRRKYPDASDDVLRRVKFMERSVSIQRETQGE
jgi:hypothetical protein